MEVFAVDSQEFTDRLSFNQYLADNYDSLTDRDLYILTGLSEHGYSTFLEVLQDADYQVVEDLGTVKKIEKWYDDGDRRAQFYMAFDDETDIVLFYSDMRKTEEIEGTLGRFLRITQGIHYLFVSPQTLQTIREQIIEEEPAAQISEFVAKRTERTETEATYRPEFARTINYYGDDGLEALREMERYYGVLPRIMEFNVPGGLQFRVNREGVFKLANGDLSELYEYIQLCIEKALEVKEAYEDAKFQMVPVSKRLSIATSEPVVIELQNQLQYHEVGSFKSSLQRNNYVVLDSYIEEGSLYFLSKIIDETKTACSVLRRARTRSESSPRTRRTSDRSTDSMRSFRIASTSEHNSTAQPERCQRGI
jgi:hypothetical protein